MRRLRFYFVYLTAGWSLWMAGPASAADAVHPPAASQSLRRISPVEFFRALLGMSPAEREKALARKSPADREIILAKIAEYEALPRAVREARLCQTELHWELSGLIRLPAARRSPRLNEVSPLYRPLVESLLAEWDALPPESQKLLLEKQGFIAIYLRMEGGPASARQSMFDKLSPDRRAHWAREMERWQALPEEERAQLCGQFQHFFALSGEAQKETVSALSEVERREMEATLQAFDRLPPMQRDVCIRSFQKFSTMSAEERNQFLKNAVRWDAMTAHERELWRNLVQTLPPMPPMPADLPPMPPGLQGGSVPSVILPPNVTAPVVVSAPRDDVR